MDAILNLLDRLANGYQASSKWEGSRFFQLSVPTGGDRAQDPGKMASRFPRQGHPSSQSDARVNTEFPLPDTFSCAISPP